MKHSKAFVNNTSIRSNSGIGKEMATYAASKNATVYMICRSKERAEKARDDIIQSTQNENVKVFLVRVNVFIYHTI